MSSANDTRRRITTARRKHSKRLTAQGEESRTRLLDATIQLICERGYAGTSVGAVCKEAGLVKTALYWHFGSKVGLLSAVIDEVAAKWEAAIHDPVYGAGEPVERLDKLLQMLRHMVDEHSYLLRIGDAVLGETANVSPEVLDSVQRLERRTLETISVGFENALQQPVPDADLLSHTLLSLVRGAHRAYSIDPQSVDLDRYFTDMRRTILSLVQERTQRADGQG